MVSSITDTLRGNQSSHGHVYPQSEGNTHFLGEAVLRWTWWRLNNGDIYAHIRLVEGVLRENNASGGRACSKEGDHDSRCREGRPSGQSKLILHTSGPGFGWSRAP